MSRLSRALSSHRLLGSDGDEEDAQCAFECNICLDVAKDPVVTMCGHLYCWPCLYRWVERNTSCPVCKDHVDQNRLIPIYCRQPTPESPADTALSPQQTPVPPRPAGLRLLMPDQPDAPPAHATTAGGFAAGLGGAGLAHRWGGLTRGRGTLGTSLRELQHGLAARALRAPERALRRPGGRAHLDELLNRYLNSRQRDHLTRGLLILGSFVIVCLLLF